MYYALLQEYKLKISNNELLSSSNLYLALALQKLTSIETFTLLSKKSEEGVMTVVIGDDRGRQNTCPTNANT